MADADKDQPIIIKKINKGHGGHHGGSWKVAFADFMTAMMAFFLVMWLVGQSDRVKESVAGYFRDPGKFQNQGRSGVLKGSDAALNKENGQKPGVIQPKTKKEFLPSEEEVQRLQLMARNLMGELEKQSVFKRLKDNIKLQMTSEGLRIVLNESAESPAFFEPGSPKLLQKSAVILMTIAKELGQITNHLVIEGHTDNAFTGNKGYSNWELSADRANAARQLMEVSGLYNGQVREVRGYADRFPMIHENPTDPRNRRISLIVLYESREKLYDEIEVGSEFVGIGDS